MSSRPPLPAAVRRAAPGQLSRPAARSARGSRDLTTPGPEPRPTPAAAARSWGEGGGLGGEPQQHEAGPGAEPSEAVEVLVVDRRSGTVVVADGDLHLAEAGEVPGQRVGLTDRPGGGDPLFEGGERS